MTNYSENIFGADTITLTGYVMGDRSVGKTLLLKKNNNKDFEDEVTPSTDSEYFTKSIMKSEKEGIEKKIKVNLWVILRKEDFSEKDFVILVYDITNKESYNNLKNLLKEIKEKNPNLRCVLIGNKKDLEAQRQVNYSEAEKFAQQNEMAFYETSAKNNENIEKMFSETIKSLIIEEKHKENINDKSNESDNKNYKGRGKTQFLMRQGVKAGSRLLLLPLAAALAGFGLVLLFQGFDFNNVDFFQAALATVVPAMAMLLHQAIKWLVTRFNGENTTAKEFHTDSVNMRARNFAALATSAIVFVSAIILTAFFVGFIFTNTYPQLFTAAVGLFANQLSGNLSLLYTATISLGTLLLLSITTSAFFGGFKNRKINSLYHQDANPETHFINNKGFINRFKNGLHDFASDFTMGWANSSEKAAKKKEAKNFK